MSLHLNEGLHVEEEGFSGWNFSRLNKRWTSEELPWDYMEVIKAHLRDEHYLLDLGTGSGEFLLRLNHPHGRTFATEVWEPNLKICKGRLEPLGISVKRAENVESIPFSDDFFDIVTNRHEAYDLREVWRVLKPGGIFITQQVGGLNNEPLCRLLFPQYLPEFPEHNLENQKRIIEEAGFQVIFCQEYFPKIEFYDLEMVVFFAKMAGGSYTHFLREDSPEVINKLRSKIDKDGYIESTGHRFVIVAQRD